MLKRIFCALLAVTMVFSAVIFTSADTISELEDQQAALEQEAAEYEAIISDKQNEIDKQQEYVDALTAKIATVNEEISVIREKIDVYNDKIAEKAETINSLNVQSEENMDLLRQRLRSIYLAGNASSIEIIMGAKDFTDFVDKLQLVESLSDYDAKLMDQIESQLDGISDEIKELNEAKEALEKETEEITKKQEELNGLLSENKTLLANLFTEREELGALLDSNEASQNEVEQQIQAYYEEQKRLEQERLEQESGGSSDGDGSTPIIGNGDWVWPTPGYYDLSSGWAEDRGYSHGGIDIAGPGIMGSTIVAAHSGTVIDVCNYCEHNWGKYGSCGCGGGYGNYVWIDHGDGKATIYAHMTEAVAYVGQTVSAGELIGYVGSTGYSTGPHLHFEARYYGERYDPMTEYP
ncbi:MAG: hypothetical protein E7532_01450 [Ruminococcaceae bacterium]|nr:hypothetical protein [Oscillospiraceae bacterium]